LKERSTQSNSNGGTVNAFYDGVCDSFNGQECSCCDRECERGHLFKVPSTDNTTFEECCNGAYSEYLPVGNTCIKKLDIIEV
jgi:hypothetical protein